MKGTKSMAVWVGLAIALITVGSVVEAYARPDRPGRARSVRGAHGGQPNAQRPNRPRLNWGRGAMAQRGVPSPALRHRSAPRSSQAIRPRAQASRPRPSVRRSAPRAQNHRITRGGAVRGFGQAFRGQRHPRRGVDRRHFARQVDRFKRMARRGDFRGSRHMRPPRHFRMGPLVKIIERYGFNPPAIIDEYVEYGQSSGLSLDEILMGVQWVLALLNQLTAGQSASAQICGPAPFLGLPPPPFPPFH